MARKKYDKNDYSLPDEVVRVVFNEYLDRYENIRQNACRKPEFSYDPSHPVLDSVGGRMVGKVTRATENTAIHNILMRYSIERSKEELVAIDQGIAMAVDSTAWPFKAKQIESDLRRSLLYGSDRKNSVNWLDSGARTVAKYRKIAVYYIAINLGLYVPEDENTSIRA